MRKISARWLPAAAAIAFLGSGIAAAVDSPSEMLPDPKQESRAEAIGRQLRCLVCQNESIEDSGAALARDLRHVVRQHVAAGESDRQITDWMVQRYGDFIRLRPPLGWLTAPLYAMPVLSLLVGLSVAVTALRQMRRRSAGGRMPPLDDDERERLARFQRE